MDMEHPDRIADEATTNIDLAHWHRQDRPYCPNDNNTWQLGPPGFACTHCDWWCSCR